MWNSLHPIVLPAVILHLVPDESKNTYLGLLTFFGLILAMVIQPISGAISDGWHSRLGKRRPLAIIGTALDFIFLAILAWSGSLVAVIIGYVGLQMASNIAHGPMQGLLPDLVPDEQMGSASGLKNLMDMGGLIIASLAAGHLLSPDARHPTSIMIVVMLVLAASACVTFLTTREQPSLAATESKGPFSLRQSIKLDIKNHKSFFWLILSRLVFLLGVYGIQTFAQYYIRDVMQAANPVKATGDLMAALAVALVACSLLGGWLTDKFGERRVLVLASLITAIGCILLVQARDLGMLTLYGGVMGAGIGFFLTSNWSLASRLAPKEQAGKFLGLTNIATAGASALSKLWGIPIDILNHSYPGEFLGYSALFSFGAVCGLLSLAVLARVYRSRPEFPN
jgi:MFS family permease